MRSLTSLILALTFIMPASMQAYGGASRASAAGRALNEFVSSNKRFVLVGPTLDSKTLQRKLNTEALNKPKEAMVGVGQTLLLIMSLTAIDLTRQEIQLRKGKGSFNTKDIKDIAYQSVTAILDNPNIYAGILGAGGLGLANKPAQVLLKVMTQPRLLMALRPVLASVVASTITFVGWEFGSQLWNEASLRLESEADVKRATSVAGLGGSLLKTIIAAGSKEDGENRRVAKLMMKEMVYILLHASTLRAWFDNTIRLRVMTGEFSTLLTSMIAAGAIGTAIFPGAGTLAGALFGLVGGVTAMFLPQGFKDSITDRFQDLRVTSLRFALSRNSLRIEDSIVPIRYFAAAQRSELIDQARKALRERRTLRSKLATVYWEKIRRSVVRLNSKKLTDAQFNGQWASNYRLIKAVYADDIREVARLQLVALDSRPPLEVKQLLEKEQKRLKFLVEYLSKIEDEASFDDMLKLIEINYSKGVNESEFFIGYLQALAG